MNSNNKAVLSQTLMHYGVKGMRWGKRKSSNTNKASSSRPSKKSQDHLDAVALKKKRPSEMSNAELKKLNERMQLEASYAQLTTKSGSTKVARGQKIAKTVLGTAKTVNDVYNTANSPAMRELRKLVG